MDFKFIPGNIDLKNRPFIKNSDGSISTVKSVSFTDNEGKNILIPTVMDNGVIVSPKEAWSNYLKTGKHLGIFQTPEEATKYAILLHKNEEQKINKYNELINQGLTEDQARKIVNQ